MTLSKQAQTIRKAPHIPETWPTNGPDFNRWNSNLSGFARLIELSGAFWCMDMQLKYLTLWTDTRDGSFIIKDRDGEKVEPVRVLAAMRKWEENTSEYSNNWKEANTLALPADQYTELLTIAQEMEAAMNKCRRYQIGDELDRIIGPALSKFNEFKERGNE